MSNEINFIKEIEKRECLYNYNLPEYNRRDITERAWSEVARNSNYSISECKEKWRNIRSSLLRSMKKSDKFKKPYYLCSYLQFVIPFMKMRNTESAEEFQREEFQISQDNQIEIEMNNVKCETDVEEQNPFEIVDLFQPDSNENASTSTHDVESPVYRRRRRQIASRKYEERKIGLKRKRFNASSLEPNEPSGMKNNSSMRYFLLSLLPEFETMTEDQIRTFKIKVMMLIDDLKSNFSEVTQNSYSSDKTERLQKRLINLLLRNLKKRP